MSEDSDGDDVYYYIDWDDGSVEDWIGPFSSGVIVTVSHVWEEIDNYAIRAKAKDTYGAESDWGYKPIEIAKNLDLTSSLFVKLLERFSNALSML
jgi:hypothetical protein